ncbi:MAG: glycosyltransferase [Armatimonadetes bacterium]|nr:glycosyltransferase [Armatimonadota bacterium]NIM24073.1 glycosyltransferase [Armatimonadota bacterium]NIM67927.1 glycosyltransferase [Armatimonadota bacterium]NIM76449.1 glycosyltransferase [Armatimonadota bacterium]NIN06157.1 glycosyltransferase [Armatimonadota bacterium]
MKIALVGPTYPFRGGISHYTTLLCRTLRQKHEVKFISFKRQYPKLLFPGKTDRDESAEPVKVEDVDYLIDSLNPFTWRAAAEAIREFAPDEVVFPWWVSFWAPQFWAILRLLGGKARPKVVFICHNVVEHESSSLKKMATRAVLSKADLLITHSREESARAKRLLGEGVKIVTAFHPTYAQVSGKRYDKEEAKARLELSGDVLLFFGFVREYKGLRVLLEAMPEVLKQKEVTLLVVGEFWKDKSRYMEQISRHGMGAQVKIFDAYVPNEEVGLYFAAADLVVQPYLSASGSGVCQIAYGFDRPVIATNVGSLPEVIQDGENGRIVEPGSVHSLAKAVTESLEPETLRRLTENAVRTKERFSWERMADIVAGEASA